MGTVFRIYYIYESHHQELRVSIVNDDSECFKGLPEGIRLFAFDHGGDSFIVCSNDEDIGRAWYRHLAASPNDPVAESAAWLRSIASNQSVIRQVFEREVSPDNVVSTDICTSPCRYKASMWIDILFRDGTRIALNNVVELPFVPFVGLTIHCGFSDAEIDDVIWFLAPMVFRVQMKTIHDQHDQVTPEYIYQRVLDWPEWNIATEESFYYPAFGEYLTSLKLSPET